MFINQRRLEALLIGFERFFVGLGSSTHYSYGSTSDGLAATGASCAYYCLGVGGEGVVICCLLPIGRKVYTLLAKAGAKYCWPKLDVISLLTPQLIALGTKLDNACRPAFNNTCHMLKLL